MPNKRSGSKVKSSRKGTHYAVKNLTKAKVKKPATKVSVKDMPAKGQ